MADPDSRTGVRYAGAELLEWVARVHAPHDEALERAHRAPETEGLPAIQVGASEGRLLELLLRMVGARRVVEIGTLAGYSALWMARALPPDGWLVSLESEPHHAEVARAIVADAGLGDRVEVRQGNALEQLPELAAEGPFDAVFVDADKGHYDRYGAWAADNLRPGGLLIGDNAFFFGRLLEGSAEAEAVRRFHERAAEAFHSVCVPTPDGMLLGVRR